MPYGWKTSSGKFVRYKNPNSTCPGCSGVFSEPGPVRTDIPPTPLFEPWNIPQAGIWPQNPYIVQYPYITPIQNMNPAVLAFSSPQLPQCSPWDAPSPYCAFARLS